MRQALENKMKDALVANERVQEDVNLVRQVAESLRTRRHKMDRKASTIELMLQQSEQIAIELAVDVELRAPIVETEMNSASASATWRAAQVC